jgi:hypothetical protein
LRSKSLEGKMFQNEASINIRSRVNIIEVLLFFKCRVGKVVETVPCFLEFFNVSMSLRGNFLRGIMIFEAVCK